MPSACGMEVYSEPTSMVTRYSSSCRYPMSWIMLRKCLVSLIYEGVLVTRGFRTLSIVDEMRSVGESIPDTIGLPGLFVLCIFGSR